MKKYLLTIFGKFESESIHEDIAITLTAIVDSPNLKFYFGNGVLIFHFASEMDIKEIHEFLELTSYDLYESFILSEYDDKVSVFMSDENKKHLFDLENESEKDTKLVLNPKSGIKYVEDSEDDTEDEFVTTLLNEVKKHIKTPTLDQLLDKIKDTGIKSLTPFEKGTLDNYSKI